MYKVLKRDGVTIEEFNKDKIRNAIYKSILGSHTQDELKERFSNTVLDMITDKVVIECEAIMNKWNSDNITVELIQDIVERTLIKTGFADTAKAYILYRQKRTEIRNTRDSIANTIQGILMDDAKDNDAKRENGNVNGDTAMGTMLQIGSNVSKNFYVEHMMSKDIADAYTDGYIHIHDLDFYALTLTCCQIDFKKLAKNGFNTGHGHLREPNSIGSYATLAAIAIQSNQNDQFGGQSIPNFDYSMTPGIYKSFRKAWDRNNDKYEAFRGYRENVKKSSELSDEDIDIILGGRAEEINLNKDDYKPACHYPTIVKATIEDVERECYQAMEGFVHNLNTLHSRAGAQVPFSSLNLGTDTSNAGRMVTKNLLLAMEAGLGHGETCIFPIVIFKVKEGVNYNPEDPNYDLLQLSYRVTGKRLFPKHKLGQHNS